MVCLLAISGSLRQSSSNTLLLQAAKALAPEGVEITLYHGIGDLPHFNPDLDEMQIAAVQEFRNQIAHADGLLISSPEYAHGMPGTLKNALDWLVSGEEFIGKPVTFFNASPQASYILAALTETITVMSGQIVTEAILTVPLRGTKRDTADIVADEFLAGAVRAALATFARAIEAKSKLPGGEV